MAHLEEIPRGPGIGQTRFRVVPGPHVEGIDYERLVEIITVPPERFQIFPGFPEPQRRGPGRTLFEQGARGVIFPTPIDRTIRDRQATQSSSAATPSAPPGGLSACLPSGGTMFNTRSSVAAGATDVTASARIPFPFIISHITFLGDGTILPASDLRIKISDDNDTSGGLATSGVNILEVYTQAVGWRIPNIPYHVYPYHLVRARNKFIKVARQNSTAGALIFDITVDIIFLE